MIYMDHFQYPLWFPSRNTDRMRKARRLRRGNWTSLKRRLEVQKLRLAAANLTDKDTKDRLEVWKNLHGNSWE